MFGESRRTPSQQGSTRWQHHVVGCFAGGGTGELHKIDGIMRMENDVGIIRLPETLDPSKKIKAKY